MRVRVPKNRRVDDLEARRGWASLGCRESDLSERLGVRAEAILRMLGEKRRRDKGGDQIEV